MRRPVLLLALLVAAGACKRPQRGSYERFARGMANDPLAAVDPGVVAVGGAPDSVAPATTTTIAVVTVTDSGIQAPDSLPTGAVELRVTNKGQHLHEARLLRLADNVDRTTVVGTLQGNRLPTSSAGFGGAGPIEPGHSLSVTQVLTQPGTYLFVCGLPSPDGKRWFSHGVFRALILHGSRAIWRQPPLLVATAVITTNGTVMRFGTALTRGDKRSLLIESRFFRSTQIARGDNLLKVDQRTGQGHDLVIMRGVEPSLMRAYTDWLAGDRNDPPPGIIGGIPGLYGPIMTFYIKLQGLTPGTYTIFCPKTHGKYPDFELGEVDQFQVF